MSALFPWFDDLVCRVASEIPWRAVWAAPETLGDATRRYRLQGQVIVSRKHCGMSIFACPETNHAFRAWHDWHHIRLQAPFDREGELRVTWAQFGDCLRLLPSYLLVDAARVLECEVLGQFDYQALTGQFPVDQRAFTVEYFNTRYWRIEP